MFLNFKAMRNTKNLRSIVCEEAGNEILVNLDTLIQWSIILKCFPLPMDLRERAHTVRNVKFAADIPKKMIHIQWLQ